MSDVDLLNKRTNQHTSNMVSGDEYENVLDNAMEEASDASETTHTTTLSNDQCLRQMDNAQICAWMAQKGASDETVDAMRKHNMDGREMMYCFNIKERKEEDVAAIGRLLLFEDNEGLYDDIRHRVNSEAADERLSKKIERKKNAQKREQKKTELRTARERRQLEIKQAEAEAR